MPTLAEVLGKPVIFTNVIGATETGRPEHKVHIAIDMSNVDVETLAVIAEKTIRIRAVQTRLRKLTDERLNEMEANKEVYKYDASTYAPGQRIPADPAKRLDTDFNSLSIEKQELKLAEFAAKIAAAKAAAETQTQTKVAAPVVEKAK